MQDFTTELQPSKQVNERQKNFVLITYIVFTVGLVLSWASFTPYFSIFSIAGLVMAYLKRSDYDNTIYESHMTYIVQTFWIGFLYTVISFIIHFIITFIHFNVFFSFASFLLIPLTALWYIIRIIKGFVYFYDNKAIKNSKTWFF